MGADLEISLVLICAFFQMFVLGYWWMRFFVWYDEKYGFKNKKRATNICLYGGIILCFCLGMMHYMNVYNARKKSIDK